MTLQREHSDDAFRRLLDALVSMDAEASRNGVEYVREMLAACIAALRRSEVDSVPSGLVDAIDWLHRCATANAEHSEIPESPAALINSLQSHRMEQPVKMPAPEEPKAKPKRVPKMLEADSDLLREFIAEAREHLDNADVQLLTIETNPQDTDALNAVFRAFHTIKGVAGFLSLEDVQELAHESESLLDKARKGELVLSSGYMDVTFDAVDMMKKLIVHVEHALSAAVPLESEDGLGTLVVRIKAAVQGKFDARPAPVQVSQETSMRMGEILVNNGLARTSAVEEALASQVAIQDIPLGEMLVREVVITRSQLNEALEVQKREGNVRRLGEVLADMGAARWSDIEAALAKQQTPSAGPIGELLVRQGEVSAKDVAQALRGQKQRQLPVEMKEAVKVDADRLDRLIDLIGELVIAESMVSQSPEISRSASQQLSRQLNQLDKITRELQEMGTSLRMVPVRATFQKMARLVRDLAKKSGKKVEFITEGEDTELDKTVVDKIGDPLIHMVRNAVDHGLENSPADRVAAGKSEAGNVKLRSFHKGGSIYIEIEDDGRGLNREAIVAKGKERGLIREGDNLSDREVFNLIFEPGFSTAKEITDVSGRGVGMDVVRRNIESLRGQIEIQSERGKGSIFSIRLPLTLAIIDGMVVRVGQERYIVPTLSVVRSVKLEAQNLSTVVGTGEMLSLQGELIPLFRLHKLFDIADAAQDPLKALVLILEDEGKHVGLMIDELLGQQQIVIKSLGEYMKGVEGVAGGAIMPDGTVGLIIDVGGVVEIAGAGSLHYDGDSCQPAA